MKWERIGNNAIIDGDVLFGKGFRTEDSKVAKYGNVYYMAIASGKDGNSMDIYLLKSDLLSGPWIKVQDEPIIKRGNFLEFDYLYIRVGGIVYSEGFWYLHYSGQNLIKRDSVGVAVTSEKNFPLGWKKYEKNPILKPRGISWESRGILTLSMKEIGSKDKKWYGHYTGQQMNRRYNLGACYSKSPCGPFVRSSKPILGPDKGEKWNWDWRGPGRADFIEVEKKIYGVYEGSKDPAIDPTFQIGGYKTNSIHDSFVKIFPDKPFFSGDQSGIQFANPCLWQEEGKIYLLVGRKVITDHTPYWRYIDLFTLELE